MRFVDEVIRLRSRALRISGTSSHAFSIRFGRATLTVRARSWGIFTSPMRLGSEIQSTRRGAAALVQRLQKRFLKLLQRAKQSRQDSFATFRIPSCWSRVSGQIESRIYLQTSLDTVSSFTPKASACCTTFQ